ncbi:hypothetical protein OCU04_006116 [Sclerotinia nivalis]|uniref:Major facilitator superfamily (MFS) profile domain-containing protein n=1 Tax=Sclerotinia nivalis TaxID=352851 RepID=A0A9X0DK82_9HELO|nr:hypothetical protein OCU04_006116 [Sclerotinia nivalis]
MNSFMSHMGNYDSTDPADQSRKGWLTSILELGAWLGSLLSGFMAEAASRKYGILIATGIFFSFHPESSASTNKKSQLAINSSNYKSKLTIPIQTQPSSS